MPGPFPGMDPYLEDPAWWPELHQRLVPTMSTVLNSLLPRHYRAAIGERLYVVQPDRSIYPDMVVVERPFSPPPPSHGGGGRTVMVASDPPWVLTVLPLEVREVFVEIRSVKGDHQVITVIEVLSPANKTAGSDGQRLYQAKQREVLESQTHLIEIDLLRQGGHTVAAPVELLLERGHWDYLVSLHRAGPDRRFEVWAVSMRQRLPRIHVPLAEGDPDVVLDLQTVFDRCYNEGAFDRGLDYRRDPPTPLPRADAEWADTLLRERGLRE